MKDFKNYNLDKTTLLKKTKHFVDFVADYLDLEHPCKITLMDEREGNMTTAVYNLETKEIKVLVKRRAFFDIARSIAHEMVHQQQQQHGKEMDGNTGSPTEDEANAIAGRIIRTYSKQNEGFYDC